MSGCHGVIHRLGKGARAEGWWLSRAAGENPMLVPVYVAREGRLVYLTADGEYADEEVAA